MVTTKQADENLVNNFIEYLRTGKGLLVNTPENVLEVVGILKSYGIVLDEYSNNLIHIAENQFLVFFPFFSLFEASVVTPYIHDRLSYIQGKRKPI